MSWNSALRIVTAVRDLVFRVSGSLSGSPTQHLSQRAKLVGAFETQLDISILLAGSELRIVTEAVLFGLQAFEKLLRERRITLKLQALI